MTLPCYEFDRLRQRRSHGSLVLFHHGAFLGAEGRAPGGNQGAVRRQL